MTRSGSSADAQGVATPWLPEFPGHWKLTRFGRIARVNEGQVDPREEPYAGMILVAPNHIQSGTGRLIGRETAREQGADSGKYIAAPGQILYSKIRPALNKVTIAQEDCLTSADMYAISPLEGQDTRFFAYQMLARPFLDFASVASMRVKMPKINREELAAAPWLVPPEHEQHAIVDYLDRETSQIDALIGKQERLIETLRERRAAVVERTITEPDPSWPVDKLGRRTRIGNGSTPRREQTEFWAGGDFPWLNSAVVNKSVVTDADQFVTPTALAQCHLPKVFPGSLLVGLTGQGRTRGMATILQISATVSQHVAFVKPESCWNPRYLLWALRSQYMHLRNLSDENGSTKGGLTCEDLKQVRLALPPLKEQQRIAAYLDEQTAKIDTLVAKVERFIDVSKERRSALITAAVTGHIDVRERVGSGRALSFVTTSDGPGEQEGPLA